LQGFGVISIGTERGALRAESIDFGADPITRTALAAATPCGYTRALKQQVPRWRSPEG